MDRGAWQATVHGGHKQSETTECLTLSLSYLNFKRPMHNSEINPYFIYF